MSKSLRIAALGASTILAACASGGAAPSPAPAPAPVQPPAQVAPTPAPAAPAARANTAGTTAPAADIAGMYACSIAYQGQPLEISLYLAKRDDGRWGGSISADQVPSIGFNSMTVDGKRVVATLTSPDGSNVTLDFTVDGGTIAGKWSSTAGDGSAISGKKVPKPDDR